MKTSNYKMLSGKYPRVYVDRIVPREKEQEELFISELLKISIKGISEIKLSEDDSNKGSDTKCIWDGEEKGIQVTRFAISNSRSTSIVAQKVSIKILENIYERLNLKYRVVVSFDSIFDDSNDIVKLKKKKLEKLCDYIVEKASSHNPEHLGKKGLKYWMFPYAIEVPEFLKPDITRIIIQYPPDDHVMHVPGRDKIWINWNFNKRTIDENIIATESESIFKKKNEGKSEILLIWCDLDEVFNRIEEILNELKSKFQKTTFEYVFLVALHDREDKRQNGFKLYLIKNKNAV